MYRSRFSWRRELADRLRRYLLCHDSKSRLRCTQKLLNLLVQRPLETPEGEDVSEWYASVFWIERRKCILFTHAETLFCFVVPDVLKADVTPIGPLFLERLRCELVIEGLSPKVFGDMDPGGVQVTKTIDRSVVGSTVEFMLQCQHMVRSAGGLTQSDIVALNRRLRRTPMGRRGKRYDYPIDLARGRADGPRLS